ncbi:MAG TPA: hypothetical protein DIS79_09875 [Bacteroidetes bacterium]|nr:hypothetical protein [Bacteroidota bacterium]HRK05386.1 hypothetical protein [Chlorobiota bacterium]
MRIGHIHNVNLASIVLGVLVFLASVSASAQPRLDVRSLPTVGEQATMFTYDTTGVQPGNAGLNIVWQYTNLVSLQRPFTYQVIRLDAAPQNSREFFPTADRVVQRDSVYEFYQLVGQRLRLLGTWTPNAVQVASPTNPFDTRPIELTNAQPFSDTYQSSITYVGLTQPVQRFGASSVTYTGFGTLRFASGSIDSVVRVRRQETTIDTVRSSELPGPVRTIRTTTTTTAWYQLSSSIPVLTIETADIQVRQGQQLLERRFTKQVYGGFDEITTALDDIAFYDLTVAPQPARAHDVVRIGLTGNVGEDINVIGIDVVDNMGRSTTPRWDVTAGDVYVYLTDLASGRYSVVIRTTQETIIAPVIVVP